MTHPSAGVDTVTVGPDPRWGMQAPLIQSSQRTTPSGLAGVMSRTRTSSLASASDPLVLQSQVDSVSYNGRTWATRYDGSAHTITTTSAAGRTATTTLNARGYPITQQVAGLDPVSISYDARGRPSTFTQGSGPSARTTIITYKTSGSANGYVDTITEPLNRVTQYQYDAAGRVTRQILPGNRSVSMGYDGNSNTTAITPPGQPTHAFAFNPLDEISSYTPPDLGPGTNPSLYTYNSDGHLAHVSRPDGTGVDLGYDSAGRPQTLSLPRGRLTYAYNAAGKLASIAAPGGLGVSYAYDGLMQTAATMTGTISGSVTHAYDNDFRVTSIGVNGSSVNLQYDADSLPTLVGALTANRNSANGLLTGTTLGAVTDSWGFNGFGEPTSYSVLGNGVALFAEQYTRDALGRISLKSETIGGATDTYSYTYDDASRLMEVRKSGVLTSSYTYL